MKMADSLPIASPVQIPRPTETAIYSSLYIEDTVSLYSEASERSSQLHCCHTTTHKTIPMTKQPVHGTLKLIRMQRKLKP